MRLSIVNFLRSSSEPRDRPLERIVDYARQIEKRGFPGIWVTDSLGRGRPTLDPLVALGALSVATQRADLGTAVLQVSLRHPIELAHRVQSVQALSGGRLRLGVGSGSTRADFDLLGADYDQRFRTLMGSLEIMRRAWRLHQRRRALTLAGIRRRAAGAARRLAQPALDHLCRKAVPGMDRFRPLQQLGGSRKRHAALPRGRR